MLQSMRLQSVRLILVTEKQQQQPVKYLNSESLTYNIKLVVTIITVKSLMFQMRSA